MLSLSKHAVISMIYIHPFPRQARDKLRFRVKAVTFYEAVKFKEDGIVNEVKKVVLAYSGGLDTSVIVRWLIETYRCEVICFAADVGQKEELSGLREKAIKTGAAKIYIDDLREEFVRDFVFPALRANAIYEGTYLLGTSLARPLIAKRQLEIAKIEGADAVCHVATWKGNDQVLFELTYMALHPAIRIISAWRDDHWTFDSRASMIDYAEKHGIPIPLTR